MNLQQLKEAAYELDLTDEDVSAYGPLNRKATWESAIGADNIENDEDEIPLTHKGSAIGAGPAAVVAAIWETLIK